MAWKYAFLHSFKNNTWDAMKNSFKHEDVLYDFDIHSPIATQMWWCTQVFDFADQSILHSSLLCNINCNYHCFYFINEFDELLQKPTFVYETIRFSLLIRKLTKISFIKCIFRRSRDFLGFAENHACLWDPRKIAG